MTRMSSKSIREGKTTQHSKNYSTTTLKALRETLAIRETNSRKA